MNTRAISTSIAQSSCDVCGRTLLRGERSHVYLHGGDRHSVCELCTTRALHGGWVREGTLPDYGESSARVDRRRSLLGRLRTRRDAPDRPDPDERPRFDDDPPAFDELAPAAVAPPVRAESMPRPPRNPPARESQSTREPRHVRAVPTSVEHKISSAVELFNASEHPKTVAGIARSLGIPEASVLPTEQPSAVHLIVAWELCWYRYEVDLSDEVPSVRVSGQGYELDELAPGERCGNAAAGERGMLTL
ncbi:MAG: hypothetical protein ACRDNK_09060 [Solirubrobacteraceae bacterium]